jgi:enoyl-CoA hydratase/carnithine racemase
LTPDTSRTSVETVLTERRGAVLIVTLNRPDRLNAWTDEMEDRYFDVLAFADSDGDVRAIVVTGAGRGFCGGADFADLEQLRDPAGAEPQPRPRPRTYPLSIRKPVIAVVNGAEYDMAAPINRRYWPGIGPALSGRVINGH